MKITRKVLADTIRILSIDSIQNANSGHPGAPMGMADIAEVLWRDYMNHNPSNPYWWNRDRFVLSNGHCSMLLYSILHLTGYNLSIQDLKQFRRIHSKTPGHPERGCTCGVELTTGPLGQGIASAVGLAIGERVLSKQFNRLQYNIIDHYTYVFLGDGCMMEGISHESCSLAGTMKLNKLIAFYDDNGISIDGKVEGWFTEKISDRFQSYGWHVIDNIDGHDSNAIKTAIKMAKSTYDRPSLIICKTIIAFGSPNKSGTCESHGSPLGKEEVDNVRKELHWKYPPFYIPNEIYRLWNAKQLGEEKEKKWKEKFFSYKMKYPKLAKELIRRIHGILPDNWDEKSTLIVYNAQKENLNISSRLASKNVLENFGPILPELIGGSADLTPSNLTFWSGSVSINKNISGNYIHYGAREFGMTAIGNGIASYGGFIPYTSTFLVFSEYAYNAIRMSALMKLRHIMIYTHDSIGLGEDGPTHQPIEQLTNLRSIPNMSVWRPCDQTETVIAWKKAIERNNGPTAIVLSRQCLIKQDHDINQVNDISKGGYILKNCIGNPDLIFIATGSELSIAVTAYTKLIKKYNVRVVSIPSVDVFEKQDEMYKNTVLPKSVKRKIVIEAGIPDFWYKYVGENGIVIGIKDFGKSAPAEDLFKQFGFTVKNVLEKAYFLLKS